MLFNLRRNNELCEVIAQFNLYILYINFQPLDNYCKYFLRLNDEKWIFLRIKDFAIR